MPCKQLLLLFNKRKAEIDPQLQTEQIKIEFVI